MDANAFAKCAPAISTNIAQCGTVTQCNAIPLTLGDLETAYMESGDFRIMESLLMHDMEIKMCETVQNGMYEFLMANKVNLSKRINTVRLNAGLTQIQPFILMRQYSPINNEYWEITSGGAGNVGDWAITVQSTTNIPSDVRSFPAGMRIYVDGVGDGGNATKSAWQVVSAALGEGADADKIVLELADENAGSNMDAERVYEDGISTGPTHGILRRGTPNVVDVEQWCNEAPAYLNWKNVPAWIETTRHSMCKSSMYDQWKKLVMAGNPLYREFFDLDEISKNRQLSGDWMKRWVASVFWNKPLPNQTVSAYDSLETINTYNITSDWANARLGVDGGRCVGKRANAVGIYEQLSECGRVFDALGAQLNIAALARALYNIMRVREANGRPSTSIDIFTDTATAELFNQAMLTYYKEKSGGMLAINISGEGPVKTASFGFNYRSFRLFWPNVTINIITHYFFDDYLTAARAAGQEDTARVLWVLDFAGIYPGILASKRVINKTGDLKTLAAVSSDFACVMEVPTQEQTLTSMTYTVIVECPASNLIIENFSSAVPETTDDANIVYDGSSSTTATTTSAE